MSAGLLVIRCDATPDSGMGHLGRCVALAEEWRAHGGEVVFAGRFELPAASSLLAGFDTASMPRHVSLPDEGKWIRAVAAPGPGDWLVVDHYRVTPEYLEDLGRSGAGILLMDDTASLEEYPVDVVLNQNPSAPGLDYPDGNFRLLAGCDYTLLADRVLLRRNGGKGKSGPVGRVLVTMGLSRAASYYAGLVAEALSQVGGGKPALRLVIPSGGEEWAGAEVLRDCADLPAHIQWADMIVCAGGVTSFEAAFLGVPFVAGWIADNQRGNVITLADRGLCASLGDLRETSAADLARILGRLMEDEAGLRERAAKAAKAFDGLGRLRVLCGMGEARLNLRPARPEDIRLVLRWANDPVVRKVSFTRSPVDVREHEAWFRRMLSARDRHLLVAECGGRAIGQIRFEPNGSGRMVSVSVAGAYRGLGLGSRLIDLACRQELARGEGPLVAYVVKENIASIKAFTRAGFRRDAEIEKNGRVALRLVRGRESD